MKNFYIVAMNRIPQFLLIAFFTFSSCGVKDFQSSTSSPISHDTWNKLLQKHVEVSGDVDYKGFLEDREQFDQYIALLSNNHPNRKNWNKNEQLAYWINAYNAFTVKLILDHYPVASIKDIKNGIPFVNTVWDIKNIKIEGMEYDLNNIEHGIIRKKFNEPRIHFAVNCASISCPRLRNEAYYPDRLEEQLADQTRFFLNNPVKNRITKEKMELSKLFSWYKGDFTKKGSLLDFINQYAPVKINADAEKSFMDYNWNLNEQEK